MKCGLKYSKEESTKTYKNTLNQQTTLIQGAFNQ